MATIIGDQENDTLVGFAERDLVRGLGGDDLLFGRGGHDTLEGGPDNDRLSGEDGSDLLRGGVGSDWLFGEGGHDTLVGGAGRDYLTGGIGADTFRFNDEDAGDATSGLADVILDFSADDIIDLRAVDLFRYDDYSPDPSRGALGIWQANGNTYVSWNTFGELHDVEIRGYTGETSDLYNQIIWYDDDYRGGVGTDVTLADGETKDGTFEVGADEDWFRIELTAGRLYDFRMTGVGSGAVRNPSLGLYDANGEWVAGDGGVFPLAKPLIIVDDTVDEAQMFYHADKSGTYYVRADSWSLSGLGTYRLGVTSREYEDDFGDSTETAGEIEAGDTVTGEIGLPSDLDYLRLEVEAGKTYTIDMRGVDSGSGTLTDPYLSFIDPEDNWHDDSDGGEGRDARLVFSAEESGVGFIIADHQVWDQIGTYELSVTVEDTLVV
jgi:hypothetical protein